VTSGTPALEAVLADAHRSEWAFVLAATVRVAGDLDLAQECAQEAYVAALQTWGERGVPASPGAWLTTTARRKALDRLRRDATLRSKLPLLIEPDSQPDSEEPQAVPDDRLRLVFTCCHPALSPEAQVALTLRLVCGVETAEIARAFLVPEPTMAARITRAKKKIAAARIPYRVPEPADLPERLDPVLTCVHLLFTAGHTSLTGAELVRHDLVDRAIDLARTLVELLPAEPEARGLLGLMLLTDARRATRVGADGRLLRLDEQDRSRWDPAALTEGMRHTAEALTTRGAGRFTLQAAIAGVHAAAPRSGDTDWPRILRLYDGLLAVWDSPVVALNRAVAVSFVSGPQDALDLVDALAADDRLASYSYLPATRAHLLKQLGRRDEAAEEYAAAAELTGNAREREFLLQEARSALGQAGAVL
jgi:RNA polymerase sigma-70 factor (ECF subfamily)